MDLSKIQVPKKLASEIKSNPKPFWRLAVDEKSGMPFSAFYTTKRGMVEPMCELLHQWCESGKDTNVIRCDNAGENKLLEERLEAE